MPASKTTTTKCRQVIEVGLPAYTRNTVDDSPKALCGSVNGLRRATLKFINGETPVISTAAFSLVEVTLALGIAAFCLIAVFGLVPVGVQTNRNATSQTAATNILSSVVRDFRARPPKWAMRTTSRNRHSEEIKFNSHDQCALTARADALTSIWTASTCPVNITLSTRYQVNATFPPMVDCTRRMPI